MCENIDLENQIITYNYIRIPFIFIDNDIYFKAKEIVEILKYPNTQETLDNMDSEDVITLKELKEIYSNTIINVSKSQKDITRYVNESGLYSLIIKSPDEESKVFKKWINQEVMSGLKKFRNKETLDKIELENIKFQEEHQKEILKLKESREKSEQEMLKFKEEREFRRKQFINNKILKNLETIYIASSENNLNKNIFKVGGTTNISNRMPSYNTGRIGEDKFFVLKEFKVFNYKLIEWTVGRYLYEFRVKGTKELYHYPLKNLIELLTNITDKLNDVTHSFNSTLNNVFDNMESLSEESKELGNELFSKNKNNLYNYPEENINKGWYYDRYKKY